MSSVLDSDIDILSAETLANVTWSPATEIYKPCQGWRRVVKHGFDVALSLLILTCLAPLLLAVALAIKLDSPGPVLFRQKRNGLDGREFAILKFRSMTTAACGAKTVEQAKDNDPRVTRIGRILRHSSIDELPQLWNVVRGEMSLVGPRPHAVEHNVYYGSLISHYHERNGMRPGVTGLAQVSGLRGETSALEGMKNRVETDLRYIQNWSLTMDLLVLARTPAACIRLAYRSIKAKI